MKPIPGFDKIKPKKDKHKYDVYVIGKGYGCYAEDYCKTFVGTTWAISEEQACNNVRFRMRDDDNPNGGYPTWELGDCLEEGFVLFRFEAKLADSNN